MKELPIVNQLLLIDDDPTRVEEKSAESVVAGVDGVALAQNSLKGVVVHQLGMVAQIQHLLPDCVVVFVDPVKKAEVNAIQRQMHTFRLLSSV